MADYRGGDRRESVYGQELIGRINRGETERQRSRNFRQKLAMAGVQAALQLARGGIEMKRHADATQAKRTEAFKEYANSPVANYQPMAAEKTDAKIPDWLLAEDTKYANPNEMRPDMVVDGDVMGALKATDPYGVDPSADKAEEALAENDIEPQVTWGRGRGMMRSQ